MKQAYQLAQNKIDYIVFHNPKKVSELLYNQGYEPPKDPIALSEAIKELSRKKGRTFIEDLVQLHPDKQTILSVNQSKAISNCGACKNDSYNTEGNYCKSCGHSNYMGSGDEDSFLGQFEDYKDNELEKYYRDIVRKSNDAPENKNLAQEVQMIWNEIRKRKEKPSKPEQSPKEYQRKLISRDDLILIGVVFCAGALVGHGLKFNSSNGK
ncbi:hypothetical protein [Aquimarina agarivorans]|uniref:hypothetical protein n=1 Tax=Aquimarina agarivorans TaxID=980584 RepID=UPI000248FC4D|nr:hypothetical protein [Aquimarina agarivorans]